MAKRMQLTFKSTRRESELYEWLEEKLSPTSYIKEILYREYLQDKGLISKTKSYSSKRQNEEDEEVNVQEKGTNIVEENEWGIS